MTGLLLRLYPAAWRRRYGDEFAVLLRERPLGPFDVADVLLGAIDAHLHRRGATVTPTVRTGISVSLRIGGLAAIVGAALWLAGWSISILDPGDSTAADIVLTFAGTGSLLVALVGLSAFQSRRHAVLTWLAFAVPAIGTVVSLLGIVAMALAGDRPVIGDATPWAVWMIGVVTMFGGSILFAAVTYRTAALSPAGSAALGIGAMSVLLVVAIGMTGATVGTGAGFLLFAALLVYVAGWLRLGVDAVRQSASRASLASA